jgi:hypothetical protein
MSEVYVTTNFLSSPVSFQLFGSHLADALYVASCVFCLGCHDLPIALGRRTGVQLSSAYAVSALQVTLVMDITSLSSTSTGQHVAIIMAKSSAPTVLLRTSPCCGMALFRSLVRSSVVRFTVICLSVPAGTTSVYVSICTVMMLKYTTVLYLVSLTSKEHLTQGHRL